MNKHARRPQSTDAVSELLVRPDGRIFAHNITPELAALLADLNPNDPWMRARSESRPPSPPPSAASESIAPGFPKERSV